MTISIFKNVLLIIFPNTTKRSIRHVTNITLVSILLLVAGCANTAKSPQHKGITTGNINNNVAIFLSSRVEWPGYRGSEGTLDLQKSQEILTRATIGIKNALEEKGYILSKIAPSGVGYYSPFYNENWVIPAGNSDASYKHTEDSAVFVYPDIEENIPLEKALASSFEQYEELFSLNDLDNYRPSARDVQDIVKYGINSDVETICFIRIYAAKFSADRKVTAAFRKSMAFLAVGPFLTDLFESTTNFTHLHYTCVNTNAEIVWRDGFVEEVDEGSVARKYFNHAFSSFPKRI